jgi:hypothetical protein
MKCINATNLNRKSGGAQQRNLQFHLMAKPNPIGNGTSEIVVKMQRGYTPKGPCRITGGTSANGRQSLVLAGQIGSPAAGLHTKV